MPRTRRASKRKTAPARSKGAGKSKKSSKKRKIAVEETVSQRSLEEDADELPPLHDAEPHLPPAPEDDPEDEDQVDKNDDDEDNRSSGSSENPPFKCTRKKAREIWIAIIVVLLTFGVQIASSLGMKKINDQRLLGYLFVCLLSVPIFFLLSAGCDDDDEGYDDDDGARDPNFDIIPFDDVMYKTICCCHSCGLYCGPNCLSCRRRNQCMCLRQSDASLCCQCNRRQARACWKQDTNCSFCDDTGSRSCCEGMSKCTQCCCIQSKWQIKWGAPTKGVFVGGNSLCCDLRFAYTPSKEAPWGLMCCGLGFKISSLTY